MKGQENMCLPCRRFQIIQKLANTFSRYSLPALLLGASIYFFDIFSDFQFLLPFLAIIFLLPMVVANRIVQLQIYRGLDPKQIITHQLKYYSLLSYNEGIYYKAATENISKNIKISPHHRQIILYYLVEYLFLENKPKPDKYKEEWINGLELTDEEFLQQCFEYTNIVKAFSFERGVGILPDFWYLIKEDEEILVKVMDQLSEASKRLEEATKTERLYFLEDMYLIEEDLIEIIEEEQKWFEIDDVLVEFEPESPPTNVFESFKAQANENARLIEQRNTEQKIKETKKSA